MAVSEVCYGPMKSGKSRYLVAKAEEFFENGQAFLAFKPCQDTRDGNFIRSRDQQSRDIQAIGIESASDILSWLQTLQADHSQMLKHCPELTRAPEILGIHEYIRTPQLQACLIDEVFLLDSGILQVMSELNQQGIFVYLSGLDRDFRREFFPLRDFDQSGCTMEDIIRACQSEYTLAAQCEVCQQAAHFTQRLVNGIPAHYNSPVVMIGDEEYQPRCEEHHRVIGHPQYALI